MGERRRGTGSAIGVGDCEGILCTSERMCVCVLCDFVEFEGLECFRREFLNFEHSEGERGYF
jgi:hypothetical protein